MRRTVRETVVILATAVLWLMSDVTGAGEELPTTTGWTIPEPEPATPGGRFVCPIDVGVVDHRVLRPAIDIVTLWLFGCYPVLHAH